jgi:Cu+-exporting ATPase
LIKISLFDELAHRTRKQVRLLSALTFMSKNHDTKTAVPCYHCGESCPHEKIHWEEKHFCCEGCKMVFQILSKSDLCDYYDLNQNPGITLKIPIREDKFAFLDDPKISQQLLSFQNEEQVHVTFYLPQMHCSSCLYLLENVYRINRGIVSSKVNFTRKELEVVFLKKETTLRKVAETLARIGYEPYISLNDLQNKRPGLDQQMVYQIGVAGFCFGNIMLMSFPEYLGIDTSEESMLQLFRWANLFLAIPVFLYSALPFYIASWKSLKHKYLNIDAPIALAIIITFVRSVIEVLQGTGGGYFDSMTGIVFFMLAGRILQDKTYRQLSFERDYTSYFPVAVTVLKNEQQTPTALPDIRNGDTLLIHQEELIPADGILVKGKAFIDYSFVTGESLPVAKEMGEIVYAGGKQTEGNIELLVVKEVAQSYLTKLWNREEFKEDPSRKEKSFVHILSRYFTYIVFFIAIMTALYWWQGDPTRLWPAVTSIFIIACPCALLLSNTFTNGNILSILARNQFFLRNAETIESISGINHIVFDKTGTLTAPGEQKVSFIGKELSTQEQNLIASLANQSTHPLSKAIVRWLQPDNYLTVEHLHEKIGAGIEGIVQGKKVRIGSKEFVTASFKELMAGTQVHVVIENIYWGFFKFNNQYRAEIPGLLNQLMTRYKISVLSGDNPTEKEKLEQLTNANATLLFNQQPEDKLLYIKSLQEQHEKVMMIGDGLNDAGALKQADVGIALSEQSNNFTPSSDAIIEAKKLPQLVRFIRLCKKNRNIVIASFVLSIIYNIIGLYFAVQGNLSPLIAAILMPSSSISILLLTFGSSSLAARQLRL